MTDKKIVEWYMNNYSLIDPIISDILMKLKSQLYLPTHTKTIFYIDYDMFADELIKYMYKTSYLR